MLKSLVLAVIVMVSTSSYAIQGGLFSSQRIDEISSIAAQVRYEGYRLDSPLAFAEQTHRLEESARRKFSKAEIELLASQELRDRPISRARCFTGQMRVLTPSGYRAIETLKVGDEVYSWDEKANKMVMNEIAEVYASEDEVEFGRLLDVSALGVPLEVTPDHPFYSAEAGDYKPLSQFSETEPLLRIFDCDEALSVARGRYQGAAGKARVYTLRMQGDPSNFIVEGVLVHNKPIHIT